jgi:hypothetical protein
MARRRYALELIWANQLGAILYMQKWMLQDTIVIRLGATLNDLYLALAIRLI